jgi:hypothetical protein
MDGHHQVRGRKRSVSAETGHRESDLLEPKPENAVHLVAPATAPARESLLEGRMGIGRERSIQPHVQALAGNGAPVRAHDSAQRLQVGPQPPPFVTDPSEIGIQIHRVHPLLRG